MAEERSQRAVNKEEVKGPNKGQVKSGGIEKGQVKSGGIEALVQQIMRAQNILVALSKNPSVDELVAAIGLTMALDGMQKNATAVYSGETPNAIRFLKPDETFEKSIDGLRDFIVVLNKNKAGRIEYKEEGDFVRVYISPRGKKISEDDLEFARGAVNVDLVIALNAKNGGDLDVALAGEGSALQGKTVANITAGKAEGFGQIEWCDKDASSMSEMVTALLGRLQGDKKLTREVATALLTGIVAKTDKFMSEKTTPNAMNVAQRLMMAGANPILIAESMKGEGILSEDDGIGFMDGEVPKRRTAKKENVSNSNGGSLQRVVTPEKGAQDRVAAEEANRAQMTTGKDVPKMMGTPSVDADQVQDNERGHLGRLDKVAEEIVNEKREEQVQAETKNEEEVEENYDAGEVLGEGMVKARDKIRKSRIYPGVEDDEIMIQDALAGKDFEAMMDNELGDKTGSAPSVDATTVDTMQSAGAAPMDTAQVGNDLQTNSSTMDSVGGMGEKENLAAAAAPQIVDAPEVNHIPEMNYTPQEAGQVNNEAAAQQANDGIVTPQEAGLSQETGGVVNFRAEEMAPISAPQRVAQPMSDSEIVQPWQMDMPEMPMPPTETPGVVSAPEVPIEAAPVAEEVAPEQGQDFANPQDAPGGQSDPGAFRIPGM